MKHPVLLSSLLILPACTAAATPAPQGGSYVTMLGHDTVAVERFTEQDREIKGTSVSRSPRTTVRTYTATLNAQGLPERFHVTYQPFGGRVTSERDYRYSDDSVWVTMRQDTTTRKSAMAVPGRPFPLFADILAPWDASLRRALHGGARQGMNMLAGRQAIHYDITGTAPGRVKLDNPEKDFAPLEAVVGKEGELEKLDLTATTDKFVSSRVPDIDVQALAADFAGREHAGNALGILSPRDTAQAVVSGAHVLVDYGRPAMRGRKIFGGKVVPWEEVWRTGANAATQLVTDRDLRFDSVTVPAGTYSLFTLPSENGWKLIVNQQHGQWGTVHDPSKDLARLPLKIRKLAGPVERLTFEVDATKTGGVLKFSWERTEASIPFKVL